MRRRRPSALLVALLAAAGLAGFLLPAAGPNADASMGRLVEDAVIAWGDATPGTGSFSGLVLDPDGSRFVTVSDRGRFATGRLLRQDGRLTGVEITRTGPLLDARGAPVEGWETDAEGLTRGADERIYVSFEGKDRVDGYDDIAAPADPLPRAAPFRELVNNSGLESLFTGPDGALYTITENPGGPDGGHRVFRHGSDGWSEPFSIPHHPPHLPTGADLGPDGRLYLLERDFSWLFGFSTRIRRFRVTESALDQEEVLLLSRAGTYDNLEGLSVWTDPQGRIRLTAISDDNGSVFQRSEIVEFILQDPAGLPTERR